MRSITFRIEPPGGTWHSITDAIDEMPDVRLANILGFGLTEDDTVPILCEFTGDAGAIDHDVLDRHPDLLTYELATRFETIHVYALLKSNELLERLLDIESRLVVTMPIECTDEYALKVTAIGEVDDVRREAEKFPDTIDLALESVGEYAPETDAPRHPLTEKQRDVLATANRVGYYSCPREATHEDIAEELELSAATVSVHLQKIEERILSSVM